MKKFKNETNNINSHAELDSASTENKALYTTGFRIKSGMTKSGEYGRSMVEMLGVLAVIGVLSVAGIAGYTTAMQSYRTNEILNATSMFYVLAMSQNQGNGPSGKIDYSNVGGTNPFGATLEYENNVITITFTDTKDCTAAKNKLGDKATDDCANKKLIVNFGETTVNNFTPPTYETCVAEGRCEEDSGKYSCKNGSIDPPYCTDACKNDCNTDTYNCDNVFGGICNCKYIGTYPNCTKPACIDTGACGCGMGECDCSYGGTYPDNCIEKPECINAGTCGLDWNDGWKCTYGGTYPDNCNPKP